MLRSTANRELAAVQAAKKAYGYKPLPPVDKEPTSKPPSSESDKPSNWGKMVGAAAAIRDKRTAVSWLKQMAAAGWTQEQLNAIEKAAGWRF